MEQIQSNDKERISQFIKDNELDYQIVDNVINKYHIIAHDDFKFFPFNYSENKLLMTLDPNKKDQFGSPTHDAHTYTQYETLTKMLEFISHYDKSLNKTYWYNIPVDDLSYDLQSYNEEWFNDFIRDGFEVDEATNYKYISFTDTSYKPKLRSPFNTLHDISPINGMTYETVNKLNFEIHPVTTIENREMYLVKLLSNNEEVLKEYVNWVVVSRKGLRLFLETLFTDMERFKVNESTTISEFEERLNLEIEGKEDWIRSITVDTDSLGDDDSVVIVVTTILPASVSDESADDFYDNIENYVFSTDMNSVRSLITKFCKKYDYTLLYMNPNDNVERGDVYFYYEVRIGGI